MLMWSLKIIKLYINCDIIGVVMGIMLSIIGDILSTAQKHIGKILNIIDRGLVMSA